jgi:hypothetical protein
LGCSFGIGGGAGGRFSAAGLGGQAAFRRKHEKCNPAFHDFNAKQIKSKSSGSNAGFSGWDIELTGNSFKK